MIFDWGGIFVKPPIHILYKRDRERLYRLKHIIQYWLRECEEQHLSEQEFLKLVSQSYPELVSQGMNSTRIDVQSDPSAAVKDTSSTFN